MVSPGKWLFWIGLIVVLACVRKLPKNKRYLVFRMGRFVGFRGPGEVLVIPMLERAVRVDVHDSYVMQPGAVLRIGPWEVPVANPELVAAGAQCKIIDGKMGGVVIGPAEA